MHPPAPDPNLYSYLDGTNTPRQLSNPSGGITLSARYTPWGDTLDTSGTGNFTFGYFGGVMDAATGLLYVGNGQYYDPSTGRFLSRGVNPDSTNPYIPWNPIGTIIGPLGLLSMIAMRRRGKVKKNEPYLFLFIMLVMLPLSVGMACNLFGPPAQTQPPTQPVVLVTTPGPTTIPPVTSTETAPVTSPTPCDCTPTPTQTPTPSPSLEQIYKITFKEDGMKWDAQDKDSALRAVVAVAQKFTETIGGTAADAWARTYEYMEFQMGNCTGCAVGGESAGFTRGSHNIDFAGISNDAERGRNLVVHELGHAFKHLLYYKPGSGINVYSELTAWRDSHPGYPDRPDHTGANIGGYHGFHSAQNQIDWQVSLEGKDEEEFADQFLGWVFNKWEVIEGTDTLTEDGQARADMMNANMPSWVLSASSP